MDNQQGKRIGVLTSGGDAPGMNGVIRAVTRTSINSGVQVMGIRRGYHGLYKGEVVELNARSVSGKLSQGGTFLNTARSEHFMTEEGLEQAAKMTKVFDLDGVVACGGDGTMKGAAALARVGVPLFLFRQRSIMMSVAPTIPSVSIRL